MDLNSPIFLKIPCLSEDMSFLKGQFLRNEWFPDADKRYLGDILNTFIQKNQTSLRYLGIRSEVLDSGKDAQIGFATSQYIGAVPLVSPLSGKQIGDFIVTPRFIGNEDGLQAWAEIVQLLELDIQPEYLKSLPLLSSEIVRPPFYLICADFIKVLEKAIHSKWVKFTSEQIDSSIYRGNVNWNKYVQRAFDPELRLLYPTNVHSITPYHKELFQILYVFKIAKLEIESSRTPLSVKLSILSSIRKIEETIHIDELTPADELKIHQSDFPIIKKLKAMGNLIIRKQRDTQTAWRIDGAVLFEKYVQHIIKEVSKEIGAVVRCNEKIYRQGATYVPEWVLNHLEPDVILSYGSTSVVIDAKYKAHMFNQRNHSEYLKNSHREDLHQIFSYSSLFSTPNQLCILAYPDNHFNFFSTNYGAGFTTRTLKFMMVGLPMKKESIPIIKEELSKVFVDEFKRNQLIDQAA